MGDGAGQACARGGEEAGPCSVPLRFALAAVPYAARRLRFDKNPSLTIAVGAAAVPRAAYQEPDTMRLAMTAIAFGLFTTNVALAESCPQMMEEFGDALVEATANDSPPASDRAMALALHDEGEALYDAGDEDQCVEKLDEALEILSDG